MNNLLFKKVMEDLIFEEGYRPTPYTDPVGKLSIGYGFFIKYLRLNKHICDLILKDKIFYIKLKLDKKLKYYKYYPDNIKIVLIELAYQIGVSGALNFSETIKYLNNADYKNAAKEIKNSKLYKNYPSRVNRLAEKILDN